MLSINTNLSSLIAQNSMSSATKLLNQAVERMTTGYKINHSKDNAANYSISKKMNMQISSFDVAADNVAMGMDLVTTASDIISNMQDKASRLQALCTQARNGTYGQQSLDAIKSEVNAIMKEIDRLCSTAEYNGVSLFEGGTEGNGFISDPKSYSQSEVAAMTTMSEAIEAGSLASGGTYSISSAKELEALAEYVNDGNDTTGMTFVLGKNIDLSSVVEWTSMYWYDDFDMIYYGFNGTFDGNGHIIKNLTIDSTEDCQGLFGYVGSSGQIKNVGVENCNVKGQNYVGGLVGKNSGVINNCYTTGYVTASNSSGGLVGFNGGSINNSFSTCAVIVDSDYAGGLVGELTGSISSSYAAGLVEAGSFYAGGLVGCSYLSSSINNCYATGDVSGYDFVAGLVGDCDSSISNSYATGNVTGMATSKSITNSDDWDGTKFSYETISNTGMFTLQIGINSDSSCQISFNTNLNFDLSVVNADISSDEALASIMNFQALLSDKATALGAVENRLQSAIESIEVNIENLTSSLSTIRDADIAEVSSEYIRQQILQQASATLLATANQSPSIALQLI